MTGAIHAHGRIQKSRIVASVWGLVPTLIFSLSLLVAVGSRRLGDFETARRASGQPDGAVLAA